jgi:hypothetical protein
MTDQAADVLGVNALSIQAVMQLQHVPLPSNIEKLNHAGMCWCQPVFQNSGCIVVLHFNALGFAVRAVHARQMQRMFHSVQEVSTS